MKYPSSRVLTYEYDKAGRTSKAGKNSVGTGDYLSSITYAPNGGYGTLTYGNGVSESWTYNSRLQAKSITASKGASQLLGITYEYEAGKNNGNPYQQIVKAGAQKTYTQTYTYDGLNRLAKVEEATAGTPVGGWWASFDYGRYGNRWVSGSSFPMSFAAPIAEAQYNSTNNRIAKTYNNVDLPVDAYDAAGNLQNHPEVGQMVYDGQGRLVRYSAGAQVVTFDYDAEGRRVRKTGAGGTATVYAYDASGNLAAEYATALGSADCQQCFLTVDALGSTRLLTDANGVVKQRRDYMPFGEEILASATFGNRQLVVDGGQATYNRSLGVAQQFTGKERDAETGLDYFGARYFSGAQGRMTSPDPFMIVMAAESQEQLDGYLSNPQRWNRYAYALNNPLRFIDPTGLDPISVSDCQKDSECTVVKLNVVLDKNADIYDKNGNLRQDYQAKLNTQLAQAADEYGNANIAFDVNYSSAAVGNDYVGEKGAVNVVVTDSRESFGSKSWVGPSGASYVRLNIGTSLTNSYNSTLSHELAHHFTGDTRSSWSIPLLSNTIADYNNDAGRAVLRNWNTTGGKLLRSVDPFLYLHRRETMQNVRQWYGGR